MDTNGMLDWTNSYYLLVSCLTSDIIFRCNIMKHGSHYCLKTWLHFYLLLAIAYLLKFSVRGLDL